MMASTVSGSNAIAFGSAVSNPSSHSASDTPSASSDLSTSTAAFVASQDHDSWPESPSVPVIGRQRSRSSSNVPITQSSSKSFVKRKPLPPSASPVATRLSLPTDPAKDSLPKPAFHRSYEVDSPTLYENPLTPVFPARESIVPVRNSIEEQRKSARSNETTTLTIESPRAEPLRHTGKKESLTVTIPKRPETTSTANTTESVHASLKNDSHNGALRRNSISTAGDSTALWSESHSPGGTIASTMSMFSVRPTPPHITLPSHKASMRHLNTSTAPNNLNANEAITPPPKSPNASKLTSFFGWGGNNSPNSSTASFSNPATPDTSPTKKSPPKARRISNVSRVIPPGIDTERANAKSHDLFGDAFRDLPPTAPSSTGLLEEMEDELKAISAELATSIRREMELEDLVERLQSEVANSQVQGRRTSDYFSDSGTSSVRYTYDNDSKADELDRLQRKTEREKAAIRLELHEKVQDERSRRKDLETQIRTLEEKASQVDHLSSTSMDSNTRLKELENTCEDLRRRLGEERRVKDNFEDLLTALKSELQNSHNERDNLRDEILPQLRSRVEGLEAQALQHEKLTYENTKMQQEMQILKNQHLKPLPMEPQSGSNRFSNIMEETPPVTPYGSSLSRSNSTAQRPARAGSITRTSSVKITESREALAERVKDIEMQRDALHSALKNLLERQEHQNRENDKKLRQLAMDRDRILSSSPKRQGYDRDVANLRVEINTLRRRADEAIEQKWHCEKGLSGLKMDLDRSEQEIASLRNLLAEKTSSSPSGTRSLNGASSTSASLEKAYRALQTDYAQALEKIKSLETSRPKDVETVKAMKQLEKSLLTAISERDFARQEADDFRNSISSLQSNEKTHITSENSLADELRSSAQHVEELATQVRQQIAANGTLRQRLSETIERGERDQKANASRIVTMQGKLRSLEDAVLVAQQASEEHVVRHEEEIRGLKESHNAQLLRMKKDSTAAASFRASRSLLSSTKPSTTTTTNNTSPLTPLFSATPSGTTTPRLDFTTSGRGLSLEEQTQTDALKRRIIELEKALQEADAEMEEVVGRMNTAQIEVMELMGGKDEGERECRRLRGVIERMEREMEALKVGGFEERWRSLTGGGGGGTVG